MLAEEGYSLPDEPPKPRESFRLWRKDRTTEEVSSTRTVEEVLDNRFDKLLSKIPVDWFKEQTALRASADDNYLLEPIALCGNIRATSPPVPIHRFAYALMLASTRCEILSVD
jgi:hypothetical protein